MSHPATPAAPARPQRVVSGMRPTGALHLGHYFGALRPWVELQAQAEVCFFFSADWHALTTHYEDPGGLAASRTAMLADWLACGIDPARSVLFYQSRVPQHAELFTLLGMIVPIPWLERVPSYKDVRQQLAERDLSTIGFLGYPLLQAADILPYRATAVPVGEDQLPHLELTREVVRRFNHLYGRDGRALLVEPQGVLHANPASARLPGLDGRKMSKSFDNAVYLSDEPAAVEQKILRAVTDPARVRKTDPGDPDKCPVFQYQLLFQDQPTLAHIRQQCTSAGWGCVQCKRTLLGPMQALLAPIRTRRAELLAEPARLEQLAEAGSTTARAEAEATLQTVRAAMGVA